jgi:hypothetical protein
MLLLQYRLELELELEILLVASLLTYWEVPMDKAGL